MGTAILLGCGSCLLTVDALGLLPASLPEKCKGQVPCTPTSRDPFGIGPAVPVVPLTLSPCSLSQGKS